MHQSRLATIVIDCRTDNLDAAASFWARALGAQVQPIDPTADTYRQIETADDQPTVLVQQVDHPSRVHLDIETDDVEAEVWRLEQLGARRVAQVKSWWVMEAPTGQRFCVVKPQRPDFPGRAASWP